MSHKLWSPPSGIRTNIDDFRERIAKTYELQLGIRLTFALQSACPIARLETYWDLYDWSIKNVSKFWQEFWSYADIKYSVAYDQVRVYRPLPPPIVVSNSAGIGRQQENE